MPPRDPSRILVTGDVHGNTTWVTQHVLAQARKHDCVLDLTAATDLAVSVIA